MAPIIGSAHVAADSIRSGYLCVHHAEVYIAPAMDMPERDHHVLWARHDVLAAFGSYTGPLQLRIREFMNP